MKFLSDFREFSPRGYSLVTAEFGENSRKSFRNYKNVILSKFARSREQDETFYCVCIFY